MRDTMFMEMLGRSIRDARLDRGLRQRDLGQMVGVTHNTICQYEHGRRMPDVLTLARLAQGLGINIDDLVPTAPLVRCVDPNQMTIELEGETE